MLSVILSIHLMFFIFISKKIYFLNFLEEKKKNCHGRPFVPFPVLNILVSINVSIPFTN